MSDAELLCSATRDRGDLAGVFEYDGETAYFYLYRLAPDPGTIVASLHIYSGTLRISDNDVGVEWDAEETRVGVLLFGTLWGVIASDPVRAYGGYYEAGKEPDIPGGLRGYFS